MTDRGREFCNEVNQELYNRLNITRKVTSPYHPQTNGLTERYNQTLCNALVKYVNEMQDNWDQYLDQVAFATRTCQQRATKETPFYLVYGRQARLPVELDIPCSITKETSEEEVQEILDEGYSHIVVGYQEKSERFHED